ncbi:MAG: helix-turn-helix transcriptional regulator [Acidimicrobiales bacterium]
MAWDDVAGELLRRIRAERRLSQRELARLAGVTQSTISDIESGKRQPSLPLLGRIVDAGTWPDRVALRAVDADGAVATVEALAAALRDDEEELAFRVVLVFRDALLRVDAGRLARLVAERPPLTGDARYDAFVAAVVDDVCSKRGVATPPWTAEQERICSDTWFLTSLPELHEWERANASAVYLRHGVVAAEEELASV